MTDMRRRGVSPLVAAVATLTLLAAALRFLRLAFDYAQPVGNYDGAVYLSGALALVDGRLPYRDFVLTQPPGIVLLLSPVALLGKAVGSAQALGLAKVLTGLAGTASVPLVAVILRHRGPAVAALGAAVLAVQSDAIAAAWAPILEPWLVLCCLGAVAFAFDQDLLARPGRLAAAGVLLGFACTLKIWALVPALVLVVVALRARRGRPVLLGVLLGAAVPALPFLLVAPHAFWRQVVIDQLARSAPDRTSTAFRLVHLFASSPPNGSRAAQPVWGLEIAVALAVLVLLVLAWVRRPPRSPLEWFAVGSGALVVGMLLVPDTFYWHYAAFGAPFIVLAALLRLPRWRPAVALVGAAVLVLAVVAVQRYARPTHPYDNHVALQAAIPKGACLVSSTPGATVAADRFSTRGSCPLLIDPFGEVLAATRGHAPTAAELRRPAVVRIWLEAYRRADFVYLQPRDTPLYPTDGPAQRYLDRHFHRLPLAGPGRLYARTRG